MWRCVALSIALIYVSYVADTHAAPQLIEVTGRATIHTDLTPAQIQRRALEQALYLAALKGAAKVEGWSKVDHLSHLKEEILVSPDAEIIDYTIIDEQQTADYYEVRIEAAIASAQQSMNKCGDILPRHLTFYRPNIVIYDGAPFWVAGVVDQILGLLRQNLEQFENIHVYNYPHHQFQSQRLARFGADMDYASLMQANMPRSGDYAIVPSIKVSGKRDSYLLAMGQEMISLEMELHIIDGETYQPVFTHAYQQDIKLAKQGYWQTVNLFLQKSPDRLAAHMVKNMPQIAEIIARKISCQAYETVLKIEDGKLIMRLGEKHGLKLAQLGVSKTEQKPWLVLKVSNLDYEMATLEPLDSTQDIYQLEGQKIRMMEVQ